MSRELHKERLATTDEKGKRAYLYPEETSGKFKNRRERVYWFLISLYLLLPWIKINGLQSILIDIPKREFFLFGTIFYGHDAPLLFFLLLFVTVVIGFITAVWGRIWCGWGCPQTVFIHAIYQKIERLVEGTARQRRELDRSPLSPSKLLKKLTKWFLFLVVSLLISHSFVAYFLGTEHLFVAITSPPSENIGAFISMLVITLLILFDFGWFREQFCIIACPYGRFQSVLMDQGSLVVTYDSKRGEPRRGIQPDPTKEGDCINCGLCVKVCPTGIDIRRGTQLECIACTLCMDACDSIMPKVNKPLGLIRYDTEEGLRGVVTKNIRPRTLIYLVLIAISILGLTYNLISRPDLSINVVRSRTPYVLLPNSLVQNQFDLEMIYQKSHREHAKISVELNSIQPSIKLFTLPSHVELQRGKKISVPLFIQFPTKLLASGNHKVSISIFEIESETKEIITKREIHLVGPLR